MANAREGYEPGGRLSDDEVAHLAAQISSLTAAGMPLAPGLHATAEEMPHGRLRRALESVAGALDGGASVEEAIAAQGNRLPAHLRGLVLVGTRTGKMTQVLSRFVAFVSVGTDLRRRLWISLAYPFLSLILAFGVFVFICTGLVASFENIFKDFGIPLPKVTIALITVSHAFSGTWGVLIDALIALFVLWLLSYVFLNGPTRRSMISGVPVVGAVWRYTSLAEFCHLLALLLECEIPLREALRLTADGVSDATIDRACEGMGADVEQGLSLSQAIAARSVFPKGLARLLRWAEGHQSLSESLHMTGEMFEARARSQAAFAGTVLAVLSVMSVLGGISAVVVGLLLPMITLISRLAG